MALRPVRFLSFLQRPHTLPRPIARTMSTSPSLPAGEDKKRASSVADQLPHELNSVHRPEDWGTRILKDESKVFEMNAWDHAPPPDDLHEQVERVKKIQREKPVTDVMKDVYNSNPAKFWDKFYNTHQENFFKDRKWLRLEFPELMELTEPDAGKRTVVEIGCGAGNALFPIMEANNNPELTVHGFDYADSAIKVVKSNPSYANPRVGKLNAAVWDLSSPEIPSDIEPGTVDICVMVFVLSALRPGEEWERAMGNVWRMLKPGGMILFRDYGRHDLAQMRIKGNRMLDEDFYIRGDGTRVFFFDSDDLARIFTGKSAPFPVEVTTSTAPADETSLSTPLDSPSAESLSPNPEAVTSSSSSSSSTAPPGLSQLSLDVETPSTSTPTTDSVRFPAGIQPTTPSSTPSPYFPSESSPWHPPHPLFDLVQLGVDRRLLVNRKKQLKMYRVWMQVKVKKLDSSESKE